jgi:acetylornithine deacetylase/succinyl-diaminopimelate desuccinylase-like protein
VSDFTAPPEVVDLIQQMIRNRCVNDGSAESGEEQRNVDLLESFFAGSGLALERHTSAPGRESLVARIEGSDPNAPSLLLMGHTDVVPVNEDRWRNDPFGGELIDGEIWGRGAIDMFNLTSSMAYAVRELAKSGYRPKGDVVYLAVADEEAGGT